MKQLKLISLILLVCLNLQCLSASGLENHSPSNGTIFSMPSLLTRAVVFTLCVLGGGEATAKLSATLNSSVCPLDTVPSELVYPAANQTYSKTLVLYNPINPASDSLQSPYMVCEYVCSTFQPSPDWGMPNPYYPLYSATLPGLGASHPDNSQSYLQLICPESPHGNE
jgi:hypothetical protein